jgi:hypothetical protein
MVRGHNMSELLVKTISGIFNIGDICGILWDINRTYLLMGYLLDIVG